MGNQKANEDKLDVFNEYISACCEQRKLAVYEIIRKLGLLEIHSLKHVDDLANGLVRSRVRKSKSLPLDNIYK